MVPADQQETERREQLAALRFDWEGAYAIEHNNGRWFARRLDTGRTITAPYPDELDRLVTEDYEADPVETVKASHIFW